MNLKKDLVRERETVNTGRVLSVSQTNRNSDPSRRIHSTVRSPPMAAVCTGIEGEARHIYHLYKGFSTEPMVRLLDRYYCLLYALALNERT